MVNKIKGIIAGEGSIKLKGSLQESMTSEYDKVKGIKGSRCM